MITKCLNDNCTAELHYLRSGRVYVTEIERPGSPLHETRFYWLCRSCVERFDVRIEGDRVEMIAKAVPGKPSTRSAHVLREVFRTSHFGTTQWISEQERPFWAVP